METANISDPFEMLDRDFPQAPAPAQAPEPTASAEVGKGDYVVYALLAAALGFVLYSMYKKRNKREG